MTEFTGQATYLTSLSSNTPASIRYTIRREFEEHPVSGLQKAELYIYSTSQSIRIAIETISANNNRIKGLERDLKALNTYAARGLGWLYRLIEGKYLDLEIESLQAMIHSLKQSIVETVPMLEDAQSELATALEEKDSILREYPIFNTSKKEVMALTDRDRLAARIKRISATGNPGMIIANQSELAQLPNSEGLRST